MGTSSWGSNAACCTWSGEVNEVVRAKEKPLLLIIAVDLAVWGREAPFYLVYLFTAAVVAAAWAGTGTASW